MMSMAAIRISSEEPFNFLERAIRSNLIFTSSVHLNVMLAVSFSDMTSPKQRYELSADEALLAPEQCGAKCASLFSQFLNR